MRKSLSFFERNPIRERQEPNPIIATMSESALRSSSFLEASREHESALSHAGQIGHADQSTQSHPPAEGLSSHKHHSLAYCPLASLPVDLKKIANCLLHLICQHPCGRFAGYKTNHGATAIQNDILIARFLSNQTENAEIVYTPATGVHSHVLGPCNSSVAGQKTKIAPESAG